ncbi:hypothetical protein H5410_063166 [Solanum commersonii]|uniref:Uncharacterized protein n=1 Tax=Solanum commersonii TaxID=4109 RepID=A0A9J5WEI1_SOLCO|nr:hypothetical protein H5410_063166 [Solanum commersonii]
MKSKVSNMNKFLRILALPWKVLTKARDCYVNNMINFAVVNPQTLPRSCSASHVSNYESEDYKELVRVASCRRSMRDINLDLNFVMQQQIRQQMSSRKLVMKRSCSVGMARIDE